MQTSSPVLAIDNLSLEFPAYKNNVKALNGVTLHVNPGEIVGVVGESGSGKSVTAMLSMRLLPERSYRITAGSLSMLGRDMLTTPEKELLQIRGRDAAMIFQEPMTALNPTRRIGRQMLDVIIHHQKISAAQARLKAIALLRDMHIASPEHVLESYPFELSGGMRQRVMIALAFSCEPQLLIADEPTTALDVTVQAQIFDLLKEIQATRGTSIILITHDFGAVREMADRVMVMYAGHKIEEGTLEEIRRDALHPYTRGLLRSMPQIVTRPDAVRQRLPEIPGSVPDLINRQAGCPFGPRCPQATRACMQMPRVVSLGAERTVKCWLAEPRPAGAAHA